jgi:hypothetical protein
MVFTSCKETGARYSGETALKNHIKKKPLLSCLKRDHTHEAGVRVCIQCS